MRLIVGTALVVLLTASAWAGEDLSGTSSPGANLIQEEGGSGTSDRLDEMQKRAGEGEYKKPVISDSAREQARKMKERTESPEFKARQKEKHDSFAGKVLPHAPQAEGVAKTEPKPGGYLRADERVYLFISSSMPESTIRNYIVSVSRLRDPSVVIVLRGLVGKNLGETGVFMGNLLKKDPDCKGKCEMYLVELQIDPLLYRKYRITNVPAVVFAAGVKVVDPEMSEGMDGNAQIADWQVVYGDASLGYILGRIGAAAKSPSLERMADALR